MLAFLLLQTSTR